MTEINRLKPIKKARIGLYSAGLNAYWSQFPGLYECLMEYNRFIEEKLSQYGDIFNFGMVDNEEKGKKAGVFFNENDVDIIFSHSATYYTSSCVLPIHQICKAPVIILNLQPTAQMNYEKTGTDRWLAQCVSCPIPEISNAFNRAGIKFQSVSGLLGYNKTPEFAFAKRKYKG